MKKVALVVSLKIIVLALLIAPQAVSQGGCNVDQALIDLAHQVGLKAGGGPQSGGGDVYVSNLSFIDGVTKTSMLSEEAKLIDQVVEDGMQGAQDANPQLVINGSGHTVPNTAANVTKMAEIAFNLNLTPEDRFSQLVRDLLDPHGVDILVSGTVVDQGSGGSIHVKVMAISEPDGVIKTKEKAYANRDTLFVEVKGTLDLSQHAREEIKTMVQDVLK